VSVVGLLPRNSTNTYGCHSSKAGFVAVEWRGEGSPHKDDKAATNKSSATSSSAAAASNNDNYNNVQNNGSTASAKDVDYLDEKENMKHSYGSGGWLGTLSIFGAQAPANGKKKGTKKDKESGLLGALASWW
jgi:hypothetical protein